MKALALILIVLAIGMANPIEALGMGNRALRVLIVGHDWYRESTSFLSGFSFYAGNEVCVGENFYRDNVSDGRGEASSHRCLPLSMPPQRTTSEEYVYRVVIRNGGSRAIKAIEWDYVFLDPETNVELGRHRFYNDSNFPPGKDKILIAISPSPPTRVISARLLQRKRLATYTERVEIRNVVYADHSSNHSMER